MSASPLWGRGTQPEPDRRKRGAIEGDGTALHPLGHHATTESGRPCHVSPGAQGAVIDAGCRHRGLLPCRAMWRRPAPVGRCWV